MADDVAGHEPPPVPEDVAPDGAVIAGIDGQDHDAVVAGWASREAALLGVPLHLQEVIDLGISLMAGEGYLPITSLPAEELDGEYVALRAASQVAASAAPQVRVTTSSAPGSVAGVLVSLSESASAVVVGGGGKPGSPFLGSTALSIAAHSKCPTVVVPDHETPSTGQVVVGIDGSRHSRAAAEFALAYADRHGAAVRAVICWSVEMVDGCVVTTPGTPEWKTVEDKHVALVEGVLADLRTQFPKVQVEVAVRRGKAANHLVEESAGAELLAIGGRGRGGFAGMLLGSTSKTVLANASCPVGVLRG